MFYVNLVIGIPFLLLILKNFTIFLVGFDHINSLSIPTPPGPLSRALSILYFLFNTH